MEKTFGELATGGEARLYTISGGRVRADITNYGAALMSLWVDGVDVVLGYGDVSGCEGQGGYLGAVIGRSANRVKGSRFLQNGREIRLTPNEGANCLHSGPDCCSHWLWKVIKHTEDSIMLAQSFYDGCQGFPGEAAVSVTYSIRDDALIIEYDGLCDQDSVFNMTNHAYFNLFGHDKPQRAMDQELMVPADCFCADDAENIPTGELRSVEGTPFDFREFKPIGRDIGMDYDQLKLQGGYDHNFVNKGQVCAVLRNPENGLTMTVTTDCPGVQVYAGNFLDNVGKGGVRYGKRSGVALETQFYPDSVNHPEWPQPFFKAGEFYRSVTAYRFE